METDTNILEIKNLAWHFAAPKYTSEKRFYHNKHHIYNMLAELDKLKLGENGYLVISLAIIFHDAVYDTSIEDKLNVEASAKLFQFWFEQNRFHFKNLKKITEQNVFEIVCNLIFSTINHEPTCFLKRSYFLEKICNTFLDLDLMILANTKSYDDYIKNIRKEYLQFSDEEFKNGRLKFIDDILAKNIIFKEFTHLDELARQNLINEKLKINKDGIL